jgi:hypothetical protein
MRQSVRKPAETRSQSEDRPSGIELLCDPVESCDCTVGYVCGPGAPSLSRRGTLA